MGVRFHKVFKCKSMRNLALDCAAASTSSKSIYSESASRSSLRTEGISTGEQERNCCKHDASSMRRALLYHTLMFWSCTSAATCRQHSQKASTYQVEQGALGIHLARNQTLELTPIDQTMLSWVWGAGPKDGSTPRENLEVENIMYL